VRGYFIGRDLYIRYKITPHTNWMVIYDYQKYTFCDVVVACLLKGYKSGILRDFLLNVYQKNLGFARKAFEDDFDKGRRDERL
jgi:hypothetical protein